MKKEKKVKPLKESLVKVSVKALGKTYSETGLSVAEALSRIQIKNIKNVRSIITVEKDGYKKDRIIMPMQTTRLFNSVGMTRDIAIKNTSLLF